MLFLPKPGAMVAAVAMGLLPAILVLPLPSQ